MSRSSALIAIVMAVALCVATSAGAQGKVELGGKTSVTAVGSIISSNPDVGEDTTAVVLAGTLNYTTLSARFEVGAGLAIIGLFADDDVAIYVPTVQGRINSDLLGAEENILLYAGGTAGLLIIDSDAFSDTYGTFGPKAGVEYYFSPNIAAQIEDQFLVDTEGGITNNITLGIKLLF